MATGYTDVETLNVVRGGGNRLFLKEMENIALFLNAPGLSIFCRGRKTESLKDVRKIPMNDFLYNLLLDTKKSSKGTYVVQKVYGGRMTETALKRLFESYMEALRKADDADEEALCFADENFEEFTAHQLRHTYCSMLQWSGVDIKTAQVLMGHSEYGVTASVYTHIDGSQRVMQHCCRINLLRKHCLHKRLRAERFNGLSAQIL